MKITVNGKSETVQPCSIAALVREKDLEPDTLVVEYNQKIVKQAHWDNIELQDNDALELLSFVGGG